MASDVTIIEKCLEVTSLLVNRGFLFKISIKTKEINYFASSGTFPRETVNEPTKKKKNVKKSPSTLQRSRLRKQEFIKRKQEATSNSTVDSLAYTFKDLPESAIPQIEGNETVSTFEEDLELETEMSQMTIPEDPSVTCTDCGRTFSHFPNRKGNTNSLQQHQAGRKCPGGLGVH